ncbi:class I SAM-dependent methyltransferase [Streptomyces sp. CMB-StM0423]|uniref:class I SAM-dependent methyltransferase n=1 Tax=Streptomyces sp. CMB-StM0423 TaxID=2059884 RepID=UPI000C6FFF1B|nr:class I SAM-dependent methyltransferase [Streptomyces sp. CMB-StM0423]AUH45159.1 SAM-dependent methyltransferase [Streptomyces sp. CMB-StM0423]
METTPDLWHHYGRVRAERDRAVPDTFRWTWSGDGGPGAEILGEVTGLRAGDLGAGPARQAAYLASRHRPARVDAIDASPAQHALASSLYAYLAPRLRLVHADAATHLRRTPDTYDVLYSVFGAVDFTDPRALLPAAATALRPGGRLVFSTLARYANGAAAQADVVRADIPARTPAGEATTMHRWVLQPCVWTDLLTRAGFAHTTTRQEARTLLMTGMLSAGVS